MPFKMPNIYLGAIIVPILFLIISLLSKFIVNTEINRRHWYLGLDLLITAFASAVSYATIFYKLFGKSEDLDEYFISLVIFIVFVFVLILFIVFGNKVLNQTPITSSNKSLEFIVFGIIFNSMGVIILLVSVSISQDFIYEIIKKIY